MNKNFPKPAISTRDLQTPLNVIYGITDERRIELSDLMNDYVSRDGAGVLDTLEYIYEIANNIEEYTYCLYIHGAWSASVGLVTIR